MRFENEIQEKGHNALVYWLRSVKSFNKIRPVDIYFIQQFHDQNEWFVKMVGDKFSVMENELKEAHDRIRKLEIICQENQG